MRTGSPHNALHSSSYDNIRKCPDSVTMPQNSRVFWHSVYQLGHIYFYHAKCARLPTRAGKIGTGDEAKANWCSIMSQEYHSKKFHSNKNVMYTVNIIINTYITSSLNDCI